MTSNFLTVPRQEPTTQLASDRVLEFNEIYQPYSHPHAKEQAGRCLDCGIPYCQWQCPVSNHIPQWLNLLKEGRLFEAAELSNQTNTLPEICGRVCPQDRLCEGACTLNTGFEAVTIGSLEKYITDEAANQGWQPATPVVPNTGYTVAIVGAGPAGLGCADVLIRHGVNPVVFDAQPEVGGLLTYGIPPFKLEKAVVQRRKGWMEAMGVQFRLNTRIGQDVSFEALLNDYDAVFLGMGAYTALTGGLDQLPGVYQALPYLVANIQTVMAGQAESAISMRGKRVVVLGGGDTAMDCTRTAIRQGAASVTCVYRRGQADMPGSRKEVKHAMEEGVQFMWHGQPVKLRPSANLNAILIDLVPGDKAFAGGVDGPPDSLEADAVIIAFGFQPSPPPWLADYGITTEATGKVVITPPAAIIPYQTSHPRVFAGGDMVYGSDLVVTAVYAGRQAAQGILRFLKA
jgi:glutamate synthase (NADPH) small chain